MTDVVTCAGAIGCIALGSTGVALCFCSGDPVPGDPRAAYSRPWQADLLAAPSAEPLWCVAGMCCAPCVQYKLRMWVLEENVENYKCCQGYFDCAPCFQAGKFGEADNPELCLLIEACFCTHFAARPALAVNTALVNTSQKNL